MGSMEQPRDPESQENENSGHVMKNKKKKKKKTTTNENVTG